MTTSLPRGRPADEQVDPAAILRFVNSVDDHPGIEMHSLMVARHGRVIAEGWWAPYSAERPQLVYSLSKSFTATAAAFAQAEGLLQLDDTVLSHFGEFAADITDPRSRSMKIRHVAAMASGHTGEMQGAAMATDPREPVRGFLLSPPEREPGTVFAYNQPCTYTLASIVQRNAGMPLTQYLRPRLLDPLGIGHVGWHTWPPGREQGFSGLHVRTEDVAKLGLLYLNHGRWEGTQLIAADFVAEATSKQVENGDEPGSDWAQGYGFQFWMSRHGYRGDGAYGQFCVVLPEQDMVIVTTAATMEMPSLLNAIWTHVLPGVGTLAPGAGLVQDQLSARLAGLTLPACAAGPRAAGLASGSRASTGRQRFRVAGGTQFRPSRLSTIEVAPAADGWSISLAEAANTLSFAVGADAWAVSDPADRRGEIIPVAASGGWRADRTFRAEVIFLETPHRMDITCSPRDGTAQAAWRYPPLGSDTLADLHCPG